MVFNDIYHIECRSRAKDNYYNAGGKEKTSIRRYLQRYELDKQLLDGYITDLEKLEFLKDYIKKTMEYKKNCNKANLNKYSYILHTIYINNEFHFNQINLSISNWDR